MEHRAHELKTWPEHFKAVLSGAKTQETRRDDRGFKAGDELILREWDPEEGGDPTRGTYTGRQLVVLVTHILHGKSWGVMPGFVVMSIKRDATVHPDVSAISALADDLRQRSEALSDKAERRDKEVPDDTWLVPVTSVVFWRRAAHAWRRACAAFAGLALADISGEAGETLASVRFLAAGQKQEDHEHGE